MSNKVQQGQAGVALSSVVDGVVSAEFDSAALEWNHDISAVDLQTYLESIPEIGPGNILVEDWEVSAVVRGWKFTFQGALGDQFISDAVGILLTTHDLQVDFGAVDYDTPTPGVAHIPATPSINTTTPAVEGVQEVQRLAASVAVSTIDGGDLVINGVSAGAPSAAAIETAIANAGGANKLCSVAADGASDFLVTYTVKENVSDTLLDFTGSTLFVRTSVNHAHTQSGDAGQNDIQTVVFAIAPNIGTIVLHVEDPILGPVSTASIAWNASFADVKAALEAVLTAGADLTVGGTGTHLGDSTVTIEFGGTAGLQFFPQMTSTCDAGTAATFGYAGTPVPTQGVNPISQVDKITFSATPTAGAMTLNGETIDWNEAAGPMANGIDPTVTGAVTSATTPASGEIVITWNDDQPHTPVTVDVGTLVNVAGTNQVNEYDLTGAVGGTYTITIDAVYTSPIVYDADNTAIQAELDAAYTPGDWTVSGVGVVKTITYSGATPIANETFSVSNADLVKLTTFSFTTLSPGAAPGGDDSSLMLLGVG